MTFVLLKNSSDLGAAVFILIIIGCYIIYHLISGWISGSSEKPQQNISPELEKRELQIKIDALTNALKAAENTAASEKLEYENWKKIYTAKIRSDAIKNSGAVIKGQITEHLAPFATEKFKFNPKDVRFIGSPIDFIVFDGLYDLKKEPNNGLYNKGISIYLLEIKTGDSRLSDTQKIIREAVSNHRVYWDEIRL